MVLRFTGRLAGVIRDLIVSVPGPAGSGGSEKIQSQTPNQTHADNNQSHARIGRNRRRTDSR